MNTEFLVNGKANGEFGQSLMDNGFDDGYFRPFFNSRGEPCVTVNTGRIIEKDGKFYQEKETRRISDVMRAGRFNPTFNATTHRFADWIHFDQRLLLATRQTLQAWTDLSSASSAPGFDAMGSMTYEYEAVTDIGKVHVSMDGRASGEDFQPEFVNSSVPLPLYHVDSSIGMRYDLVSKKRGQPMSATKIEQAGRRIAEYVEDSVIGSLVEGGTVIGATYGTRSSFHPHREASRVYGYTNHPSRQTKTDLTTPTGLNPDGVRQDVLEMRELMYTAGFTGPFMLYHSTDYNIYMDGMYGVTQGSNYGFAPTKTLRDSIREIDDIQDVRQLRRLTSAGGNPFTLLMINMNSQTAEAINGVTPRTIQWETKGGFEINHRTYAIQVPLLKYDANGNMGVVHGTTS